MGGGAPVPGAALKKSTLSDAGFLLAGHAGSRGGGRPGAQLFLRSWLYCARPRMGSMWLGRKKLSLTLRAFSRGTAGNALLSAVGRSPLSSRPGPLALRRLPRCCAGRCGGSGQVGAAEALRFNSSISRNSLSGSIRDNLGS